MKQLNELVTDKDVFDYVSSFLINQNKKSITEGISVSIDILKKSFNRKRNAVLIEYASLPTTTYEKSDQIKV